MRCSHLYVHTRSNGFFGLHRRQVGMAQRQIDIQAYLLKNPVNFGQLILVNGAQTREKKHTIVISVSSTALQHKKLTIFSYVTPPQASFITAIT